MSMEYTPKAQMILDIFDSLTGLLNRGRFFSIAEEIINLHDGSKISIALFDLDEFKEINDSMGHQMGDKVIQIAGRTIIETLGISEPYNKSVSEWNLQKVQGLAGRLGGDEFIVLYRDKEATYNPNDVLAEILRKLNGTKLDGYGKGIKSSIGYTELKESENDLDVAYKPLAILRRWKPPSFSREYEKALFPKGVSSLAEHQRS